MDTLNNWLIFSLLAALFWAVVNLLDKILVIEHIKSQWARLILDSIIGVSSCVLIYFFGLLSPANFKVIFLSIVAGVILYGFNYLYYKTLETADVSVTAVFMQTIPIFTAIWGYIFFSELFSSWVYLGIGMVILGAILANVETDMNGSKKLVGGKNLRAIIVYMLPGVFLVSLNYALQKHILNSTDTWIVFFWGRIGSAILTLSVVVFFKKIRLEFSQTISSVKILPLIMLGGVEWLNLFGIFFIISAYAIGPVTLVVTASAIQPLFVIAIVIAFSLIRKKSVLSDFSGSKTVLVVRIFASIFLILGIYLISR